LVPIKIAYAFNLLSEWYGWHFPELVKIINDNYMYAKLARAMKDKSTLTEESLEEIEEIVADPAKAKQILEAAKSSMGQDLSEVDMANIESFADRVISLADYRKKLYGYLTSKMHTVAPNLSALIGEVVGARLISQAGSLTNLSKYPASTVQILGAEKALFRLVMRTSVACEPIFLTRLARFIQRPENQGQHSQIRSHLPLHLYRSRRCQKQGPDIPFPRQQVFHCLAYRLFPGQPDQQVWRSVEGASRGAFAVLRDW
jgi:hypothetical protein